MRHLDTIIDADQCSCLELVSVSQPRVCRKSQWAWKIGLWICFFFHPCSYLHKLGIFFMYILFYFTHNFILTLKIFLLLRISQCWYFTHVLHPISSQIGCNGLKMYNAGQHWSGGGWCWVQYWLFIVILAIRFPVLYSTPVYACTYTHSSAGTHTETLFAP